MRQRVHGVLSENYRRKVVQRDVRNKPHLVLHTASDYCIKELIQQFGSMCVLRNGPRILRAMDTVRREVAAEHGMSED